MTILGYICLRRIDNKQPLPLVKPLMMKMSNPNMTQRGTQAIGFGVITGRCSLNSHHGRLNRHPRNVGYSFLRYTNDDLRNHNNQGRKRKTWTREDNQLALHCYFRNNSSQRGYSKRMIEIWHVCASFQTTSQRLADQVRTIIKKGWFSDLEILKIHEKMNNGRDDNTVLDTSRIIKQKQNWTENFGKWKRHTTKERTTKKPKRITITRKKGKSWKFKKTTLPSLRNIERRTVKTETINEYI